MKNPIAFSLLRRVSLRWIMLYFVLLFFLVDAPWFWNQFIWWVLPVKGMLISASVPVGRSAGPMSIVSILAIALLGTILWTCFDLDRQHEHRFYEITCVLTRYGLAGVMLNFGVPKLFHMFFPPPEPTTLLRPFGDFSATQLMWAFMGSSTIYGSAFAGLAEIVPSVLLFFRRTTTLGALGIAGAMANVIAMIVAAHWWGFFVWGFCGQLLLQAVFLMAPDVLRLAPALVLYRSVPAVDKVALQPGPVSLVLKVLIIGWLLCPPLVNSYQMYANLLAAQNMELVGLYQVGQFSRTGIGDRLHINERNAWQTVAIEPCLYSDRILSGRGPDIHEIMAVTSPSVTGDAVQYFPLRINRIDVTHGRLILMRSSGTQPPPPLSYGTYIDGPTFIVFRYTVIHRTTAPGSGRIDNEVLILNSKVGGAVISMRLSQLDTSKFPLMTNNVSLNALNL